MNGQLRMPLSLGIQHARLDFQTSPRHSSRRCVVEEDPQRHQYNKAHNTARSQIECVIGQLKARWKILKNVIQLNSVDQRSKLVQVLCALHNFIIEEYGDMALHDFESDLEQDEMPTRSMRYLWELPWRNLPECAYCCGGHRIHIFCILNQSWIRP